jgi:hypothetical protein
MGKYRARPCPNCNYYLGFTTAKAPPKTKEIAVTSFCLNCNYKLPIHRIIRGIRRASSPLRRGVPRLAAIKDTGKKANTLDTQRQAEGVEKLFSPIDYPRHLRVIGQDLETLRLKTFNLECTADAYLVWSLSPTNEGAPLSRLSKNRLQKLWNNKSQPRSHGQEERFALSSSVPAKRYRYSLGDIERMEQESRNRRRPKNGITDGHSVSQLLRTVGAIVGQRRERLLGISWQDFSISVVVENVLGQREIDVYRPDNIYDLWVKMYLRRDHRALSDFPR